MAQTLQQIYDEYQEEIRRVIGRERVNGEEYSELYLKASFLIEIAQRMGKPILTSGKRKDTP